MYQVHWQQKQNMLLPTLFLTVGTVFLGLNVSPFLLQTYFLSLWLEEVTVSSDLKTFPQKLYLFRWLATDLSKRFMVLILEQWLSIIITDKMLRGNLMKLYDILECSMPPKFIIYSTINCCIYFFDPSHFIIKIKEAQCPIILSQLQRSLLSPNWNEKYVPYCKCFTAVASHINGYICWVTLFLHLN